MTNTSNAARDYAGFFGEPAPLSAARRTIVIHPDTRSVNVEAGEIIRFDVGDQAFAWHFDVAPTIGTMGLSQVAPQGLLARDVTAYISPNPKYFGD